MCVGSDAIRLSGAKSPWHGYLLSLPEKANIALLWDDSVEDDKEALLWIRGTMAERERFEGASHEAQGSGNFVSDVISDYYVKTAAPVLANAGFGGLSSEEGFKHAYALASSRSFIVDNFHGLAMVPIADALEVPREQLLSFLCPIFIFFIHGGSGNGKLRNSTKVAIFYFDPILLPAADKPRKSDVN